MRKGNLNIAMPHLHEAILLIPSDHIYFSLALSF